MHTVVAPVGDEYVVAGVYGNAPGHIELTVASAELADDAQEVALVVQFLHTMVQRVHHVQDIVGIEGYPRWPV